MLTRFSLRTARTASAGQVSPRSEELAVEPARAGEGLDRARMAGEVEDMNAALALSLSHDVPKHPPFYDVCGAPCPHALPHVTPRNGSARSALDVAIRWREAAMYTSSRRTLLRASSASRASGIVWTVTVGRRPSLSEQRWLARMFGSTRGVTVDALTSRLRPPFGDCSRRIARSRQSHPERLRHFESRLFNSTTGAASGACVSCSS